MTEREKLIQMCIAWKEEPHTLADFILADRKRIVEPLVKALEDSCEASDTFEEHDIIHNGIEQTLKNAGINVG